MKYQISLFTSAKDNAPQSVEVDWPTLLKELQTHETRADKDGAAWSPTRFEGTRNSANAREISLYVADLDDCSEADLAALGERLAKYTYALHSTYSPHCYRLVLPLSCPVDALSWPTLWEGIGQILAIPADPACRDAARLYYFPTVPPGGPIVTCDNAGVLFDPLIVAHVAAQPRVLPDTSTSSHVSASDVAPEIPAQKEGGKKLAVDLFDVRRQLRAVRKADSARLVRMVLDGESLHGPSGRDDTMNRVCSIIATAVTPPIPWAAALEILRSSLAATPQERPGHLEHWVTEMEDMYARALTRRALADAKAAAIQGATDAMLGKNVAPGDVSDPRAWRQTLIVAKDKEGNDAGLKRVPTNAGIILENDPLWKGKVKFNAVTKQIDVENLFGKLSKNTIHTEVTNWLSLSKYRLSLQSYAVSEQLIALARRNEYDPLADWLKGLKWDGVNRGENFLAKYFGAIGDPRYLSQVGRCWLIAAVARALQPGCKVDNVLFLQGGQGLGKSTALKVLGGEYFSDTKFDIHDKDGKLMASRFWIIELGELAGIRKTDVESLKSFFSTSSDHIRAPYARVAEDFLRRCVYVGSTNKPEFLPPDDEQRRYWPVAVGVIDLLGLANDRDQLWAQAVEMYRQGEKWWLTGDDIALAEIQAQAVSRESHFREPIINWWMKLNHKPDTVTTAQIASDALGMLTAQATGGIRQEIGVALRELGFVRMKKRINNIPVNVYRTPQSLLDATKNQTAQIISIATK